MKLFLLGLLTDLQAATNGALNLLGFCYKSPRHALIGGAFFAVCSYGSRYVHMETHAEVMPYFVAWTLGWFVAVFSIGKVWAAYSDLVPIRSDDTQK